MPAAYQTMHAAPGVLAETARRAMPTLLSFLLPARNEAQALPAVIERIGALMRQLGQRHEIVVVDDGSTDTTVQTVQALQDRAPVVLVSLSRNFGKEAALTAGLAHVRGDVTLILDADGQHPVEMVPEMLRHWQAGADQVVGVIEEREGASLSQRLSVRLFYWAVNHRSRFPMPRNAGDFRLLDRRVVDTLMALPEHTRFMKGLYAWAGFPTVLLPYRPLERLAGQTHFSRSALAALAMDGFTAFTDLPLRAVTLLGMVCAIGSLLAALWFVLEHYLIGVDVPGWTTVVVLVSLLSGLQFLCLGVLGTYVSRIFQETKQRPLYVVREVTRPAGERE
ncbi:MAG: hypothetical protein RJA44_1913 [Pseudomonadota bacterium]